jgi:probable F420-dependent oxidoreductase
MKLGAVFPQIEQAGDPDALDTIGLAVEAMGFDTLLMYDHVVGADHEGRDPKLWGPYTDKDPFWDPFTAFCYLAGKTSRIEFFTGVLILPQRQTVLVAKQAADLDILSRQRLTLGVGTGWNWVEYVALGEDFHTRGKKMDEQIPYLRRLWEEPLVSFSGRFHHMERGNIVPRPKRQIPIFCGGFGEAPWKRAAKMADGFIHAGGFEQFAVPGMARLRELLAEEGRDGSKFGQHLILQSPKGVGLTVDESIAILRQWREMGGTHASIDTMRKGFRSAQEHVDFLGEIIAKFDR